MSGAIKHVTPQHEGHLNHLKLEEKAEKKAPAMDKKAEVKTEPKKETK